MKFAITLQGGGGADTQVSSVFHQIGELQVWKVSEPLIWAASQGQVQFPDEDRMNKNLGLMKILGWHTYFKTTYEYNTYSKTVVPDFPELESRAPKTLRGQYDIKPLKVSIKKF